MSRTELNCFLFVCVVFVASFGYFMFFSSGNKIASGLEPQNTGFTYHIVPPQNLTLIVEPDDGIGPVLSEIQEASSSIDMVMYELSDGEVEDALAAAAGRGVTVRVLLNQGYHGSTTTYGKPPFNAPAFTYLQSHNVQVKWTPSHFALTHQKTFIFDSTTSNASSLIMTFNLTPKYYAQSRDFGIEDSDPSDVSAIEKAFSADWNNTESPTENSDDLVWSPSSKQVLLDMIASAKVSLDVTSEELVDKDVVTALAAAAGRGVSVRILMTNNKKWDDAFAQIIPAGGQVHLYPVSKKALYIHEKIIIADNQQAFVGSENLTTNSLKDNRELGILISTSEVVQKLESIFTTDWGAARNVLVK